MAKIEVLDTVIVPKEGTKDNVEVHPAREGEDPVVIEVPDGVAERFVALGVAAEAGGGRRGRGRASSDEE